MIPTIGRRVWFYPGNFEPGQHGNPPIVRMALDQPCDAGIVFVINDSMVNLDVCDHLGFHHAVLSVPLVPGDGVFDSNVAHAAWMPYQREQAAKV